MESFLSMILFSSVVWVFVHVICVFFQIITHIGADYIEYEPIRFLFPTSYIPLMKKFIIAVGLLLVAAVFMSGCVTETEDPIVGTWNNHAPDIYI